MTLSDTHTMNYQWHYNGAQCLIIVRCGEKSLHTKWIKPNARYNVVLIPYANIDPASKICCFVTERVIGQKWSPIHQFIVNNFVFVMQHKYIWFPDDDLCMDINNLESFFTAAQEDEILLAQPALALNNNYSHLITLAFPNIYSRSVSFVEIMAPLFSREALLSCLWTFTLNSSGWGLEALWFKILAPELNENKGKIKIYDAFPMIHTRPVGGQDRGNGKIGNKIPKKDLYSLHNKWNLKPKRRIYSMQIRGKDYVRTVSDVKEQFIYHKILTKCLVNMSEKLDKQFKRKIGGKQGKELTKNFFANKYLVLQQILFSLRIVQSSLDKIFE